MAETEKNLREEIKTLKTQLHAAHKENETLNQCVQKTEYDKVRQRSFRTIYFQQFQSLFSKLLLVCFVHLFVYVWSTLSEAFFELDGEYRSESAGATYCSQRDRRNEHVRRSVDVVRLFEIPWYCNFAKIL